MSYTYDWCGHVAAPTDDVPSPRPCGAPIERWSRDWQHRDRSLDVNHKAIVPAPIGPMDEALVLRADRYAAALADAAAADERIAVLTELVARHEFLRSQAESQLALIQEDPAYGTVYQQTGPEPDEDDVEALLCITSGQVFRRNKWSRDWQLAHESPTDATHHQWPIADAGPFIAWRDAYGYDRVLREAQARQIEFNELHRAMYNEPGYRAEDASPWGRPRLVDAYHRIQRARMARTSDANEKAQTVGQQLRQLRRLLADLRPDDVQQWPATQGADGDLRDVAVVDLDRVHELLDRVSCGGQG